MYKTDIPGNIRALMQQDTVLERKIDELVKTIEYQSQVISVLNTKIQNLEKSIQTVGSFLNG